MNFRRKMLAILIILLPIGVAFVVPFAPLPMDYVKISQQARAALLAGESILEIENLSMLLQYSPWRGDLWQRMGRLYLDQGNYKEAVVSLEKAQKTELFDPQGKVWLADSFLGLGEKTRARQILREMSNVKDAFILMQVASLQRRLNDTFGALATLLNAYPLDAMNSELNYQLGIQLAAEEPESAVKYLQIALDEPQRQQDAQTLLNLVNQTTDLVNSPERFIYIGQCLSKIEEWDVAARAFQKAIDLAPENATALALLGEAQQQMGEDGYPALARALALDPKAETVNGLMALYYRRQSKPELALEYLDRALSANPKASIWEIEIGATLADMGELEDALTHYQKAIQMDPSDWISWRALAVFSISRNYEVNPTGIDAARQALMLNPNSPPLLDLMGTGLLLLGDLDSAERFFLQADELDPNQAAILIHLGQLHLFKNEKKAAFDYFQRAAEVAQESRLRDMANRLLIENGGK